MELQTNINNTIQKITEQLEDYYNANKIPNLLFSGKSGVGKQTIVHLFLQKIYNGNNDTIKQNVMYVNCSHGKGIKFIREELKCFAKTNIQFNNNITFKTIVLLNADNLTIDAQSALRRCIELFSYNTRFIIIVENKNRLLNPILSRFCEIYIPEHRDQHNHVVNLHQLKINRTFQHSSLNSNKMTKETLDTYLLPLYNNTLVNEPFINLIEICEKLYTFGKSSLDIQCWIEDNPLLFGGKLSYILLMYSKHKHEFRCEKMAMLYLLDLTLP